MPPLSLTSVSCTTIFHILLLWPLLHTMSDTQPRPDTLKKPALLRVSNGANTSKIATAKEHPETPPPAATANVEGTGASLPRRPS